MANRFIGLGGLAAALVLAACGSNDNGNNGGGGGATTYELTVTRAGTGSGTVSSTPAGIDCGATCAASFDAGTNVTLTATQAAGSVFAGWSGACASTSVTVTISVDAARSCTASFTLAGGGALSDVGYHLIDQAGVSVTSGGSAAFADRALPNIQWAMHAVNVNSGVASVVEAAGQWYPLGKVIEAPGNPATEQIPTIRERLTLYTRGGRLYRLDHVSPNGPPVPQLWSTVPTSSICFGVLGAFTNFDSVYNARHAFYKSPGTDSTCGTADDESWAIAYDAGPNDGPIRLSGTAIATIRSFGNAVTGYLRWVNGQVVKLDSNLANPVDLFAATRAPQSVVTGAPGAESVWLYQPDAANVLAHDLQANRAISTSGLLAGVTGSARLLGGDRDAFYFAVAAASGTSTTIIRVNASLSGSVVATQSGTFGAAYLTPTRIVYQAGSQLFSVPKAGGSASVIATVAVPQSLAFHQVTGETVWYLTREGSTQRVGVVQSDGSGARITPNATLAGSLAESPQSYHGPTFGAVNVIEGLATNGSAAGATLRTYGAAGSELATQGTFPTTGSSQFVSTQPLQVGRHGLATYLQGGALNLLLFKSDAAGLTQVTAY